MIQVNDKKAKLIHFEETGYSEQDFEFDSTIDHITVTRTYFCVSLQGELVIVNFEGLRKTNFMFFG